MIEGENNGEVKIVRLARGEELIGRVKYINNDVVQITDPFRIMVMPPPPLQQNNPNVVPSIAFVPWAEFSADTKFLIDRDHVLCIMNPLENFTKNYLAMFSKIIQPAKKLIVPA